MPLFPAQTAETSEQMAAVRFKVDMASHTLMPSISDIVCQGSFEGMTAVCGVAATVREKKTQT